MGFESHRTPLEVGFEFHSIPKLEHENFVSGCMIPDAAAAPDAAAGSGRGGAGGRLLVSCQRLAQGKA